MTSFIFFILTVWGLTHILVSSKIMEGLRNWLLINYPFFGEMLECYQCTSFWTSIIIYFVFSDLRMSTIFLDLYGIRISPDFILFGFVGSGIVSFIALFMSILIKKTK